MAYDSVDRVLSKCLLSATAQDVGINWAGPKEMFANVGGIPTERYDTSLFVKKMLDVFRAIDHDRFMLESQW